MAHDCLGGMRRELRGVIELIDRGRPQHREHDERIWGALANAKCVRLALAEEAIAYAVTLLVAGNASSGHGQGGEQQRAKP